jgi:hypothetical protein
MTRSLIAILLLPGAAQAHDSLMPHDHPHGPSLLPDATNLLVGGVVVLAVWLASRWFYRSKP